MLSYFGNGTTPKDDISDDSVEANDLFHSANANQRVDYADSSLIMHVLCNDRDRWNSAVSDSARDNLKTAVAAWYGARSLSRNAFQAQFFGVVQIRVTPKTRNPFTISSLSISGVTWEWHFLNHALSEPCLQLRDPRCQCLNLRPQRPDQRVLFLMRQAAEIRKLGHPSLESQPPRLRQAAMRAASHPPARRGGLSRYSRSNR